MDEIEAAVDSDAFDPPVMVSNLDMKSRSSKGVNQQMRSLKALSDTSALYAQMDGATISVEVIRTPIGIFPARGIFAFRGIFTSRDTQAANLHARSSITAPQTFNAQKVLVSLDCWDEFLDPPREAGIIRACGNWQTRLGAATASTQAGKTVTVLPEKTCLQCINDICALPLNGTDILIG
ncbi:hypothetical protein EJ04DRAFT_522938 [Polyplosphaeria fusca]|uniref:Uncharacterized protein n=1 Tax=Polyplosphaeria fusca TaxID=682080 RepID=A0A9P4R2I6_9PLEO|nr:hypothetical protein EJ04DRAFT_522938 [Polyplosphaeria fusca]